MKISRHSLIHLSKICERVVVQTHNPQQYLTDFRSLFQSFIGEDSLERKLLFIKL